MVLPSERQLWHVGRKIVIGSPEGKHPKPIAAAFYGLVHACPCLFRG